ncbi:MAG: basic amino acid ABC transporter substrate-binding protein [Phascolarctobacterium sp.]
MKKLLILMMTVICAVAMLAAGCGGDKKEAKKAEPAKVLRVGTEPTFAPFEFQKEGSKDYDGFDMDLARAIGKQMGAKVEIVNMGFDALIPALNANNIDLIAAGMSITDERKKAITFSEPYYTSGLIIMVNKDNKEVKSEKDLEGKRIAVQIGTTGEKKARSIKGAKVTAFNTNTEAAMELKNKGVDAVINDSPVVGYYLAQGGNKTAMTVGEVMEAEQYGLAVKKGNDKLAADVNKALAELKKNGEYDKIYKTWFGEVKK